MVDGKDYLDGIEPLRTYVRNKLKALLSARFAANNLDPDTIQITPNLAIVGPASSLTDFAMHHIEVTREGFKVSSTSTQKLPDGLNEITVRQMLSSLDISTDFKKIRWRRNCPAPLRRPGKGKRPSANKCPGSCCNTLTHAICNNTFPPLAFDLIRQVVDMPDAVARKAVDGANAFIRPLELIKTDGAVPVKVQGLYLIGSSVDATSPQVLYSPYHEGGSLHRIQG
nr:hypothetical protein GCM10020185_74340 [Pseudomonas brassicacearum subsp. brassicacearum]